MCSQVVITVMFSHYKVPTDFIYLLFYPSTKDQSD